MKLLHVDSSILGAISVTRQVTAGIVDQLSKARPGLEVVYRDLSATPLPHLSLTHLPGDHPIAAAAGLTAESAVLEADRAVSRHVLEEFLAADVVVIGAPMYNFTIPSQLKAWIDRIFIPGKTFRYAATGVEGLAGDKRVIIAISRGGFYGAESPSAAAEHVESYLRVAFGFIGVNPEIIVAEGVQVSPEHRQTALGAALRTAAELRAA